jgi:hypothetical protein
MQIAYTDTMGERNVIEKEVKVAGVQNMTATDGQTAMQGRRGAAQQDSIFSNTVLYIIGIVVIVGAAMAYRKYKAHSEIK